MLDHTGLTCYKQTPEFFDRIKIEINVTVHTYHTKFYTLAEQQIRLYTHRDERSLSFRFLSSHQAS